MNMNKRKIINNIFGYLSVLSGAIWLGAYITRMMISYQLFDVDMNLMPFVTDKNLAGIITTISPAINITFVVYILFIVSFTFFLFTTKLKLKSNGWLFIISVIVYFTLPFELYLMTIDYKIIISIFYSGHIDFRHVLNLIRERFISLSSFPVIITLCYFAIIYFLLFKPFRIQN